MRVAIIPLIILIFTGFAIYGGEYAHKTDRGVIIAVITDDQSLLQIIPNSPYAYIGGDGKMRIEITAENPNFPSKGYGIGTSSEYAFDCVFYVKNALWENRDISFTINSTSPNVLVYSPNSETHKTPDNAARYLKFPVGWGEKICVGMVFRMGDGEEVGVTLDATI
jgi:hypothetical protein